MSAPPAPEAASPIRALLHRWFVQYNPTYLLSAAMVFVGCFLWSRSVVGEGLASTFGIPLVAELYGFALIGGAAMLVRIGQRRPAVILALVALVYQWDTTLHTEACAWLGRPGAIASAGWFVLFGAKLGALGWALRVRFERRLVAAALVGAGGLALMPWLSRVGLGAPSAAIWSFALGSLALDGARSGIASKDDLDAWGGIVLQRVTRAAWWMSGALLALHALLWSANGIAGSKPIVLVLPLIAVRRIRSELGAFAVVLGTGMVAAAFAPAAFTVVAAVGAGALVLRVVAPCFADGARVVPVAVEADVPPYRNGTTVAMPLVRFEPVPAAPLSADERARAIASALASGYLAAWSAGWAGGGFPAHVLAVDVGIAVASAFAVVALRGRAAPAAPAVLAWLHVALGRGWIPTPKSGADWGKTIVVLGFAVLAGSLGLSWRLREAAARIEPRA
jgi:hypothetical protein